MKKLSAIILVAALLLALAACGSVQTLRKVSFEGSELTVTLGANKSTGYVWDYEISGECIEPSINRSFKLTGTGGEATGESSIGFEGHSEGTAVITLYTPNGWDGTGDGDFYTVNVSVGADGTILSATGSEGGNAPAPAQEALSIDGLTEGTYTGTLSGDSCANNNETVFPKISPAELRVTIEDGQITLYSKAIASAEGKVQGVAAPHSPEYTIILSGSMPLQQDGDVVTAEGKVPMLGEQIKIHYSNGIFTNWEVSERGADSSFTCVVEIRLVDGSPVAEIIAVGGKSLYTATLVLSPATQTGSSSDDHANPDMDMVFKHALNYYNAEKYDLSFPCFRNLADHGYTQVNYYLGCSYLYGQGTELNRDAAKPLLEAAAAQGNEDAKAILANEY